jgi:hypothetical protein
MRMRTDPRARWLLAAVAVPTALVLGGAGTPAAAGEGSTVVVLASGSAMTHVVGTGTEPLTDPDDITLMGGDVFSAFQNGVGSTGTASPTGNTKSTIVELSSHGSLLHQWDVTGKVDGLSADPSRGRLIATVNEDGSSSLYTVDPSANRVIHYAYSESLPHNGGADAISIYEGEILISASAPGTTGSPAPQPTYPAVYGITLDQATGVATVRPLFGDEASARVANRNSPGYGTSVTLGLTDPDSNEVVPGASPRFAGSFVLDSQGDLEQIYTRDPGATSPMLWVLNLSQAIDDTAWAPDVDGTLYATDSANDSVDAVRGRFEVGEPFVAVTPCGANSAPPTCTTPNYLGELNMFTGNVTPVSHAGASLQPHSLVFSSDH